MKRLFYIFVFVSCLFLLSIKAQTVYVTDTGKKYHTKNCDKAKTGKKGIELADAKKQGYEPCKFCKNESDVAGDKPKDKKETKTK